MRLLLTAACVSCVLPVAAIADQADQSEPVHQMEEVIVTGLLHKPADSVSAPFTVLSGEDLRRRAASSLGATLAGEPGIDVSSFGAGVGSPVIRGQSGNRVAKLQNGLATQDAAALSPDHASAIEPLLAERIEVLRGPATLQYGSGAIGGAVNVITNRIPVRLREQSSGAIEYRRNSADDGDAVVAKLDASAGSWAWHFDGSYRDTQALEIPEPAHDDEQGGDSVLENSAQRRHSESVGISHIENNHLLGVSVTRLHHNYGLPEGAHDHGGGGGGTADEHGIRIDLHDERVDLHADLQIPDSDWTLEWQGSVGRYEHKELEPDGEVGTHFKNDSESSRLLLRNAESGETESVIGLQLNQSDFSAIGEEAFIAATEEQTLALFMLQERSWQRWSGEWGLRVEHQELDSEGDCSSEELAVSAGTAWRFQHTDSSAFSLSVSRSERAASIEERYSNVDSNPCRARTQVANMVEHAATGLYEIGNPGLDTEQAHNLEWGWYYIDERDQLMFNVYYQQVNNYIYLEELEEGPGGEEIAGYRQNDAVFTGAEWSWTRQLGEWQGGQWSMRWFGDTVRGRIDEISNVPRLTPTRYGVSWMWQDADTEFRVSGQKTLAQSDVTEHEGRTEGFETIDAYWAQQQKWGGSLDALWFVKLSNLGDKAIRRHTSFLKAVAPEAGRAAEVGLRLSY